MWPTRWWLPRVPAHPMLRQKRVLRSFWSMPSRREIEITQLKTVDMTRRQCHVAFRDVAVAGSQVLGEVGQGWSILQRVLDQAVAGLCTEMVGTGQQALDMAVEYAKERVQFGKPIGQLSSCQT